MKRGMIPFFIPHQGCPHICVFCNQPRIAGQTKCVTPQDVTDAIQSYTAEAAPNRIWEVAFYGGSFTAIPREMQAALLAPATAALQAGKIHHIRCSTRPDCVDDDTIAWLLSQGVDTVELGVQTMDDDMLRLSQRGHTAAQVVDAVRRLKRAGMTVGVQLLPGLPGESWHTLVRTAVAITQLQPDIARIYPVLVIEDTTLADWYRSGQYTPFTLEEAVVASAFLKTWFEGHGITVIRTGLQATEELDAGSSFLAGPYAPAFGEMVVNQEYRWRIDSIVREHREQFGCGNTVRVSYPRSMTSKVCGLKKSNRQWFAKTYPDMIWHWIESEKQYIAVTIDGYMYVIH